MDSLYRGVVTADAFSSFEINITQNRVISAVCRNPDVFYPVEGVPVPGPLDANTRYWAGRVMSDNRDDFIRMMDRENLLVMYEVGERSPWIEYMVYDLNGNEVYLRESLSLTKDEDSGDIVGIIIMRDITEQKLVEKENMRRLRVIEGLSVDYESVYFVDFDSDTYDIYRRNSYITRRYGDCFRETYSESIRVFAETGVFPEDREHFLREMQADTIRRKLKSQVATRFIFRVQTDRRFPPRRYRVKLVRTGQGEQHISNVLLGFACVEEEMQAESAQREALESALRQARQAAEAKTLFLSNMSHDIRTPLNAIIGFTALAKEHVSEPEVMQDYLNKITESSNHLLALISDVLDITHIESGRFSMEESPHEIRELITQAVDLIRPQAARRRTRLAILVDDSLPKRIYCDSMRFSQVVSNLLGNAVKYTPEGGRVSLSVKRRTPSPRGYVSMEIVVSDNGIGMSQDFMKKIFDPFERENRTAVSRVEGSGLGLSICKGIVDAAGGTISVRSLPGKGSRFTVNLAFRIAQENEKPEEESAAGKKFHVFRKKKTGEKRSLDGIRVLVAEDNELNREIAVSMLENMHIAAEAAENGKLAVDRVAEMEPGYFDAVLMDVRMPVMDGHAAARAIRALPDEERRNVPIIAMTANAFEEDVLAAKEAGMDAYVSKPVDVKSLLAAIEAVMRETK